MKSFIRGITCIEVLIILGILVVVASIVLPGRIRFKARGELQNCEKNMKHIILATEKYISDHGTPPPELGALTPSYLAAIPICGHAERDTYSETFRIELEPSKSEVRGYVFFCAGENHKGSDIRGEYPRYDSTVGYILREGARPRDLP